MKQTLQQAINKFGEEMQIIVAMEELAELTKELSKHLRYKSNQAQLAEEMADVEIMLEQLKIIFDNQSAIDYFKAQKILRLEKLIQ